MSSRKDRDFQDVLRTPEAGRVPAVLRVRRGATSDGLRRPELSVSGAAEEPASKPNDAAEVPAIARGSRA